MRQATHNDIPAIVALGKSMHDESPFFRALEWDAEKVAQTAAALIEAAHGFVRVVEQDGQIVGGMMALATPHWSSPDLTSCDLGLFVAEDNRGGMAAARLLLAYRDWARGLGCVIINFGIMTGVHAERTEALARRIGFGRQGVVLCA
jgi:GNAT superfamily N-acetyltransferase